MLTITFLGFKTTSELLYYTTYRWLQKCHRESNDTQKEIITNEHLICNNTYANNINDPSLSVGQLRLNHFKSYMDRHL